MLTPENLTTFFFDPTIIFICGLVILTATLMLRISRKKKMIGTSCENQEFKIFPPQGLSSPTLGHALPSTLQMDEIRKTMEQWEVEMLNTTRRHKAEMDTKIVALQLLTAEATRQSEKLEQLIQHAQESLLHQNATIPTTLDEPLAVQNAPVPLKPLITETSLLEEIKIEDPFVDSDFEKAREELERFTNRLEDLDLGLPDPFHAVEETPEGPKQPDMPETEKTSELPSETRVAVSPRPNISPNAHLEPPQVGEQLGRATILRGLFPEFDEIHRKPAKKRPNITFASTNTVRPPRPPQLESILQPQNQQTTPTTGHGIEIPRTASPQAETVFVGTDLSGVDQISHIETKHDKHHQIRFLADKGVASKDIASFLDVTVGEVEMILSSGATIYRYPTKTQTM